MMNPIIIACTLLAISIGCSRQENSPTTFFALDTLCTITWFESVSDAIKSEAQREVEMVEELMSVYQPQSELFRINRDGRGDLSSATLTVLQASLDMARSTSGLYDPSIGPLVKLWDINGKSLLEEVSSIPTESQIQQVLLLVDYRQIEVRDYHITLNAGMSLDLGASAKGYAADRVAASLRQRGVERAIINLGGNVLLLGQKRVNGRAESWRIGVRGRAELESYLVVLQIDGGAAIVTSGIWERYFIFNGQSYHHILDPRSGRPAQNGLSGVTIIAEDSLLADQLATAAFLSGVERGAALVRRYGADALFYTEEGTIMITEGISIEGDGQPAGRWHLSSWNDSFTPLRFNLQ